MSTDHLKYVGVPWKSIRYHISQTLCLIRRMIISALRRLRASTHVEEDIEEMRAEEAASQTESHMSMLQLVRSSTLRMPLTIGIVMQLSQQLSGINAVSKPSPTSHFQCVEKLQY